MAQDREQDHTGCRKPQANSLLCTNNCGFFGCPTTMNLCSKCYRDLHLEEESQRAVKALGERKEIMLLVDKTPIKGPVSVCAMLQGDSTSISPNSKVQSSPELMLSKASASGRDASEPVKGMIKTQQGAVTLTLPSPVASPQVQNAGSTRCLSCRKRVGLLGFRCRCGGVFCSGHRYSDRHCCTFDYKAAGRDAIAKANPVVRAEKVEKI